MSRPKVSAALAGHPAIEKILGAEDLAPPDPGYVDIPMDELPLDALAREHDINMYLSLAMAAAAVFVVALAIRLVMCLSTSSSLKEASFNRVVSSLGSIAVLAVLTVMGHPFGCAALLGNITADLFHSWMYGTDSTGGSWTMLAHHGVTIYLCTMGLVVMAGPGSEAYPQDMILEVSSALMWMEAATPFLHAMRIVAEEAALQQWRPYLLPILVPACIGSYLWFRVINIPLCLPTIWRFREELAGGSSFPFGEVYCIVVGALAALQVFWFFKILQKIYDSGAKHGGDADEKLLELAQDPGFLASLPKRANGAAPAKAAGPKPAPPPKVEEAKAGEEGKETKKKV